MQFASKWVAFRLGTMSKSSSFQWWTTVTFKVTTLPLPLLKNKRAKLPLQLLQKQVVSNFALQTTTTFVKKGSMIFFSRVVLNHLILRKY